MCLMLWRGGCGVGFEDIECESFVTGIVSN